MKKKLVSLVLVMLLLSSLFSATASATQTYTTSQLKDLANKYFTLSHNFSPAGVDIVEEKDGFVTLEVYEMVESISRPPRLVDARYKVNYSGVGNELVYSSSGYKNGEAVDLTKAFQTNYADVLFFLDKRYPGQSMKGAFSDINGDGVKEMFVGGRYGIYPIYYLYTLQNSKVATLVDGKELCGYASDPSGMIGHISVDGKNYFVHYDGNGGDGGDCWNIFEHWTLYSITGASLKVEIKIEANYRRYSNGTYKENTSAGGIKKNGGSISVSDYLSWVNSIIKVAVVDTRDSSGSSLSSLLATAEAMKSPQIDPDTGFGDVSKNDYFYEPVKWAVKNDITSGTSATTFSPSNSCTRAQAVTFLWRAAGKPEPKGDATFSDVKSGSYYDKAVRWAVEKGITSGTGNGKFSPDEVCSRAQIVTLLYRFEGSPSASGGSFSDIPTSAYYADAVAWAVSKGITSGTGNGKFSPNDNCTRGQIVTFLYRDVA